MAQQDPALPIEALRDDFVAAAGQRPIVISSPTGSGKSTQIPRYCPGRVLVVEPRRVACRALAARVAELEGCALGQAVGYQVRDDARRSDDTRILFVTPGIALRMSERFDDYPHIILDEFHERGLEVDLLLALLRRTHAQRLVVMSATLEAERIADALGGTHLRAEGRAFPIDIEHQPHGTLLPTIEGLDERVVAAARSAAQRTGDMLIFLPGKGEIASVHAAIEARMPDREVFELHGGLTLKQQSRVFARGSRPRVILATNVAETSLTVPGIATVIDSGLVRRTRYHHGRGYLALLPIALDSAAQRTGRAGRTGPGHSIRLWDRAAKLHDTTTPEIHRESLTPMLLSAAACGARVDELTFLDPPKPHALQDARDDLRALGAIDATDALTEAGEQLFGMPLDPAIGRLLVQARGSEAVQDVVDLAAALAVGRPLFTAAPDPGRPDGLRRDGCDASALVRAVRAGDPRDHPVSAPALREARDNARRLRELLSLPKGPTSAGPVDRRRLAQLAIAADPRCAHVSRTRRGRTAFSNGGTEIDLGRDSCVGVERVPEAAIVYGARGIIDRGRTRMLITCASPVDLSLIAQAGLGRDRLARASAKRGRVIAVIERVYAKRVLDTREEEPRGELARQTIAALFLDGRLGPSFRAALLKARARVAHHALARQLRTRRPRPEVDWDALPDEPGPLEDFVHRRLEELGVERGNDLALLDGDDLVMEPLPYELQSLLDERYPATLDIGEARYAIEYDLPKRRVLLTLERGSPARPPPRQFLPAFGGMEILAEAGGRMHRIK